MIQHGAAARSKGIAMIIVAVMIFGALDGLSKMLVEHLSFGQIMLARYLPALAGVMLLAGPGGWRGLFATNAPGLQVFRGLTPFGVGGFMVLAVKYLPLAEATVILFAGPFIVVALSGLLLGERVAAASWIGVGLGFLAVVIVARPGVGALSVYTVFPALAALFYAALQVLSRQLGTAGEAARTTLAWTLLVGTVVSAPLALADWRHVEPSLWPLVAGSALTFGAGQYFLTRAFALAPASVLTPFSYFQILSAVLFGLMVFGDLPDVWTIAGIVLIVVAGLYVFGRRPSAQA